MNERFKQLFEQAHIQPPTTRSGQFAFTPPKTFSLEQFAELIVRECARVASNQVMDVEGNDWGVRYAVEKHFGVEE